MLHQTVWVFWNVLILLLTEESFVRLWPSLNSQFIFLGRKTTPFREWI
jgi:hypothetical protein